MKKTTKSLLVSALILFCAGLLLSLCSALFVTIKGIDPYGVEQYAKVIENKTVSLSDILAVSPDSNYMKKLSKKEFLRVDLHSYTGNLIIRSANETSLELINTNTANLSYEIKGETLVVKEIHPVGFMGIYIDENGFSFKGLRQIFGSGNSANSGKTVILNLASDFQVDQIDVSSNIGNVQFEGISCAAINVKSSYGDVLLKDLKNSESKINITGDVTSVNLSDSAYVSCNVSTKFGNINIAVPGNSKQSTVLDSWVGNVSVNTDVPLSEFQIILSTSIGNVLREGEVVGKELRDSSSNASRISSTLFFGDISISSSSGTKDEFVNSDVPQTIGETVTEEKETNEESTEQTETMENSVV